MGRAELAPAPGRALHLAWQRSSTAEACPDGRAVESDVSARLGGSPFTSNAAADKSIEVWVSKDGERWKAAITVRGADGTALGSRSVESAAVNCDSLAAAAELAIALLVEPLIPAPPPAPMKPAPSPPPASAPPPSIIVTRVGSARGGIALDLLGASRVLPSFAPGARLRAQVRILEHVSALLSASFLAQQELDRPRAEVEFGLSAGSLGVCYEHPLNQHWRASGCASWWLGALHFAVRDAVPAAGGSRAWWAGSAGLRLGFTVGVVELSLGAEALGHLARHDYVLEPPPPTPAIIAFREPAFAVVTSVGAGVRY